MPYVHSTLYTTDILFINANRANTGLAKGFGDVNDDSSLGNYETQSIYYIFVYIIYGYFSFLSYNCINTIIFSFNVYPN